MPAVPPLISPDVHELLARASAAERAGQWTAAVDRYEEAYRACIRLADVDGLLETLIRLGHCYRRADRRELSTECLELVLTLAELRDDEHLVGRALNGLAGLYQIQGEIDRAEVAYRRAQDAAHDAGDDQLLGDVEQNLGIVANIRGDLHSARELYLSGLERMRRAGNPRGLVSAFNNLGMLHVDLGDLHAADGYFREALAASEELGDVVLTGTVHINRAELFLALGEPERARESCDQGFEIFSRINDVVRRAEALKFYGIIYRETGKHHLAAIHLREAVDVVAGRDPLLEAEAQRELGLVLRLQGRNRDAMEALNRAHSLFRALQATPDHSDVSGRIAQIEADFLALVQVWGESIETKDRYTSGHCRRVADYACRIAEDAGSPAWEMVWFRMGAFLHDLGKTEVPAEILNKPGRLTDEERRIMERHTVIGDEMLASVEFPWDVRPMVRSHHERWDGAGYPDGLRGDAIPMAARILRIADIFDALTTTRSYRRPLTPDEALAIMDDDAGSFDPELFARFRRLFPEFAKIAAAAQRAAPVPADEPS
jgi:putative nucleotidyltransferase with HDIG domain